MYIKKVNNNSIEVAIPLTKGTGKIRIKKRSVLNEYGIPVPTRKEPIGQKCYIEWQIGYDAVADDAAKIEKTKFKDLFFTGANGKKKTLYELSEYIKYFYDWKIIAKKDLLAIRRSLQALKEDDFLDRNPELVIKRSSFLTKKINGFDFLKTSVEYPLLVYNFGKYDIIAEIKITEKQYAIGTQPMLYLCFPVTELNDSRTIIGRVAEAKEEAGFVICKDNIGVFLKMIHLFGTLSKNHNQDVISIIDVITGA